MNAHPPKPERLMKLPEVCARTGLSVATVYDWGARGKMPARVNLGSAARWRESELEQWMSDLPRGGGRNDLRWKREAPLAREAAK